MNGALHSGSCAKLEEEALVSDGILQSVCPRVSTYVRDIPLMAAQKMKSLGESSWIGQK